MLEYFCQVDTGKIWEVGKNISDVEEKLHFLLGGFQKWKMPCLVVRQCVEMETGQEVGSGPCPKVAKWNESGIINV